MGQSRKRTPVPNLFAGIEFAAPAALSTSTLAPIESGGRAVRGCSFVSVGLTQASLRAGVAALVLAAHKASREQPLLRRKDLKWRARGTRTPDLLVSAARGHYPAQLLRRGSIFLPKSP